MAKEEGQPYDCDKCGKVTVGTFMPKIYYCWECFKEEVQAGNIGVDMPYAVNWGRIKSK